MSNDTASEIVPIIFINSFLKDVFSFSTLSLGEEGFGTAGRAAADVGAGPRLDLVGVDSLTGDSDKLDVLGMPVEWLSI